MSASLVGSEMCIRDSALIPAVQPSSTSVYEFGRFQCRCQVMSRRQAPVSYTHLTLPTICSV
eukprot:2343272-Alexandrium_andersonii.AAC.1